RSVQTRVCSPASAAAAIARALAAALRRCKALAPTRLAKARPAGTGSLLQRMPMTASGEAARRASTPGLSNDEKTPRSSAPAAWTTASGPPAARGLQPDVPGRRAPRKRLGGRRDALAAECGAEPGAGVEVAEARERE